MSEKRYGSPVSDVHAKTLLSETYQKLRGQPRPSDEVQYPTATRKSGDLVLRDLIVRLHMPRRGFGTGINTSMTGTDVIYLWGDERRAVRRFIQENTEYVRAAMESNADPFENRWSNSLVRLLEEEWDAYTRFDGDSP